MITIYTITGDRVESIELTAPSTMPENTVWIDLFEPTVEEEKSIEAALDINLPTREEMNKIEVMSPFYKEGNAHYMTVTVLDKSTHEYPDSAAITFILTPEYLVTLSYTRSYSFNTFAARAVRNPKSCASAENSLAGIIDVLVNKIADVLEEIGNELDALLKAIFEKSPTSHKIISSKHYNNIIRKIGYTGNLISKNRESLVSINRLLIYFGQIEESKHITKREYRLRFKHLTREVYSLSEYANFLSQRNSFLLDATLGMIYVEQNMIIKVFTVAAAVFMPPTLIASIYGMNFKHMPELDMISGYPIALSIIVVSAILPYLFFKKKGWL